MKTEDWLNRKIDKVRATVELGKPARPEITDPVKIERKVARARKIFNQFLSAKTSPKKSSADVGFTMTFENMATTLNLSDISLELLQDKMDEVVLSVPGITKTETGYTVSDPNLIFENFGPPYQRKPRT